MNIRISYRYRTTVVVALERLAPRLQCFSTLGFDWMLEFMTIRPHQGRDEKFEIEAVLLKTHAGGTGDGNRRYTQL